MKSILHKLTAACGLLLVLNACVKPDVIERNEGIDVANVWTEIPGLKERFTGTISADKDTAYIDMSYFYPAESDNEVDLTNLILRTSIPVDATITPSLGTPMDFSKPVTLTVTSGTGVSRQLVVVVRKMGDLSVKKAEITFGGQTLEAVANGDDLVFFVLPGTDLSAATLNLQVSRHSRTSIASGEVINLTNPVPVTVTGVDGRTKTYTLVAREPRRLDYGVGINRKLWTKTAADLGFAANMEVGLAVSGNHLVMVTRTNPAKYTVLDRATGEKVGQMTLPFTGLSFQVVNDSVGNLLGASWAPKNSKLLLYKWKNALDPAPVKLVDWTNNNPAAVSLDGGVGRRVNIFGDLDKDAVIMATVGQSKYIYKWIVRNGVVQSQTPTVVEYKSVAGGAASLMGYYAEAQPVSADENTNYFVNYQFEVALVNGATNERTIAVSNEPSAYGIFHMPTDYAKFNNATYLAIVKYFDTYDLNKVRMSLLDVTNPSNLSIPATDPRFSSLNVFNSDLLTGAVNANGTADICIGFSPDKERMQVYMLLTNGGIMAHEFTKYAP
ncbi:MAG TPA: DUF5018 domain-containing protein [Chitinophagaceae bacterium]